MSTTNNEPVKIKMSDLDTVVHAGTTALKGYDQIVNLINKAFPWTFLVYPIGIALIIIACHIF